MMIRIQDVGIKDVDDLDLGEGKMPSYIFFKKGKNGNRNG